MKKLFIHTISLVSIVFLISCPAKTYISTDMTGSIGNLDKNVPNPKDLEKSKAEAQVKKEAESKLAKEKQAQEEAQTRKEEQTRKEKAQAEAQAKEKKAQVEAQAREKKAQEDWKKKYKKEVSKMVVKSLRALKPSDRPSLFSPHQEGTHTVSKEKDSINIKQGEASITVYKGKKKDSVDFTQYNYNNFSTDGHVTFHFFFKLLKDLDGTMKINSEASKYGKTVFYGKWNGQYSIYGNIRFSSDFSVKFKDETDINTAPEITGHIIIDADCWGLGSIVLDKDNEYFQYLIGEGNLPEEVA